MFNQELNQRLQPLFPDLPQILAAPAFRHDLDDLLALVTPPAHIAIIDDNDTSSIMGDQLSRALKGRHQVTRIGLGKAPKADAKTVHSIRRQAQPCQLLVAVGSGTISDLCKYASYADKKNYVVFPTAASMNGYLSANASISVKGFKTTLPAHLPKAVFCDLGVISAAPARLNKSGLGDSLARPTAQADWLLSHLLLGTKYDETPFTLTTPLEESLFDSARGIALADPNSIKLLMQNLLLSGLGMTLAGGSYPASQSEHMLAHAHEMLHPHTTATLHGEQIGVTTLTMARRQQQLLLTPPALASMEFPDSLTSLLPHEIATEAQKSFQQKCEKIAASGLDNESLKKKWPDIAQRVSEVMLPAQRIHEILVQSQSPQTPDMLGWSAPQYATSQAYARFLRDRFTCLDLT